MVGDPLRQVEDVGEDHLRHRGGAVGRDVGHRDVPLPRRFDVDDVEPGRLHADVLQVRQLPDHFPRQLHLVGHDDLSSPGPFHRLLVEGVVVDGELAEGLQALPAEIAGIEGVSVEYHNFHQSRLLSPL